MSPGSQERVRLAYLSNFISWQGSETYYSVTSRAVPGPLDKEGCLTRGPQLQEQSGERNLQLGYSRPLHLTRYQGGTSNWALILGLTPQDAPRDHHIGILSATSAQVAATCTGSRPRDSGTSEPDSLVLTAAPGRLRAELVRRAGNGDTSFCHLPVNHPASGRSRAPTSSCVYPSLSFTAPAFHTTRH